MTRKLIDNKLGLIRFILILCDIAVIVASSALGLLLRYDLEFSRVDMRFVESLWSYLPINIICTIIIFYVLKLYHSIWRFAGIVEMQSVTFCMCIRILEERMEVSEEKRRRKRREMEQREEMKI